MKYMLYALNLNAIFGITTSNNPSINKIYKREVVYLLQHDQYQVFTKQSVENIVRTVNVPFHIKCIPHA